MILNLLNTEKIIFLDYKLRKLLPDFQNIFFSWGIAQQLPELKPLAQKIIIDFLNQLEEKHIKTISDYLNEEVILEQINPNIIDNFQTSIYNIEDYLSSPEAVIACRDGDQVYISSWRSFS